MASALGRSAAYRDTIGSYAAGIDLTGELLRGLGEATLTGTVVRVIGET